MLDKANRELNSGSPFTHTPERKRVIQAMMDSLLEHGRKPGELKKQK